MLMIIRVVVVTGPEFVTSTRMKAGTATKLLLNRLTTATRIPLGHVEGNRMVDMQLTNAKLVQRGARMVSEATGLDLVQAQLLLSIPKCQAAVNAFLKDGPHAFVGTLLRVADHYVASDDLKSPFFNRVYNEFAYHLKVYDHYIHPQWDEFGSQTLYTKILFTDYDEGYAILEFIGEWNDCLFNDITASEKSSTP